MNIIMGTWSRAALSIAAGLVVFVVAYVSLTRRPEVDAIAPGALSGTTAHGLGTVVTPGRVAMVLPFPASQVVLTDLNAGARVDLYALAAGQDPAAGTPPLIRGAIMLRPPSSASPQPTMVVQVTPDEALLLTHLTQSGVRLSLAPRP